MDISDFDCLLAAGRPTVGRLPGTARLATMPLPSRAGQGDPLRGHTRTPVSGDKGVWAYADWWSRPSPAIP